MQFLLTLGVLHYRPSIFPSLPLAQIHDYGRSLSSSSSYFLELWDIGGSPAHKQGRAVFYQQVNGIILVHDLTNRKSHANLTKWLSEFYRSQARDQPGGAACLCPLNTYLSPTTPFLVSRASCIFLMGGASREKYFSHRKNTAGSQDYPFLWYMYIDILFH